MREFKGRPVVAGNCKAKALVSHGGFNTLASYRNCKEGTAVCADQNNLDLYNKSMVGMALCIPQTIGSTTGGMVLYNSSVIHCNPACLLLSKPIDSLAASGAILASVWSDSPIPTIDNLGDEFLEYVKEGMEITVKEDGTVIVE